LNPALHCVNTFVTGCKTDGSAAIKARCILAGARTRLGALTPLSVLPAPASTSWRYYNRKTGLLGHGTTKYLDSNRNNDADPQNSNIGCYQQLRSKTHIGAGAVSGLPHFCPVVAVSNHRTRGHGHLSTAAIVW
jgi:hypothetical protein